jgi:hypothetical protein
MTHTRTRANDAYHLEGAAKSPALLDAFRLGRRLTAAVSAACARAEALPFESASFDLVAARVSLVDTDIQANVAEVWRGSAPVPDFETSLAIADALRRDGAG